MELTLEYRLEIRLHALSGYLYHVSDAVLAAHFEFVEVFSDQLKAVVFHFGHLLRLYQLAAVHSGTVEFHLHIAFADDLAFERTGKGHRDIDLGDLDLDVAGLQGGRVELADVLLDDQALRYPEDVLGFVGDYRETKGDGACAGCHDHIIQRFERVDEGRYTLEGVLHQACRVARLDVAEDQRCTYRYGYCVDYAGHVLAQWDHTHVGSGLVSDFCTLVDDTAHQGYQDTLCLVALYQFHAFFCCGGCAQDNGYARDVAGYQRHAQLTDHSIRKVAVAGLLIGGSSVDVFQYFDELCAQSGGHTGHEGVVQAFFSGHQGFHHAQRFF